jgi:SAM-dependent methyltransferase
MFLEISAFDDFYTSLLGTATSTAIKTGLKEVWPDLRGQHCLGIGYAFPYLEIFGNEAASTAAITPARLGPREWGHGGGNCTALASLQALPLANAAYDRILMIHALDFTRDKEAFLEEVSRVLSPIGEIAIIVANRVGAWARNDTTPFGQGEPYTRRQLKRLVEVAGYTSVRTRTLLCFPPSPGLVSRGWSGRLERVGARLWPGLGGIILITAERRHLAEVKAARGVLNVSPAAAATRG